MSAVSLADETSASTCHGETRRSGKDEEGERELACAKVALNVAQLPTMSATEGTRPTQDASQATESSRIGAVGPITTTSSAKDAAAASKPNQPKPNRRRQPAQPVGSRDSVRDGDHVLLKLPSETVKAVKVSASATISLGKYGSFKGQQLIGKPYGPAYEVTDSGLQMLQSTLDEIEETEATNEFIRSAADGMSYEDIQALRNDGLSGREIIAKQIEQHAAYDLKTEYSKDKYKKRKEAKYVKAFTLIEPTAHNVCEYNFEKEAVKIRGIRPDTLSQIMTIANVRPGGRLLVAEDVHGLIVAAAAERMAGQGRIFVVSDTDSPPDLHIMDAFNFSAEYTAPISSIHWAASEESWSLPPLPSAEECAEGVIASTDGSKPKVSKEAQRLRKRRAQFQKVMDQRDDFFAGEFDGVIIASEYEPWSVLERLLPRIAGSAPIVVFSPYVAVLYSCQDKMRHHREFLAPSMTEPWLRRYQVLPGRTHPEMNGMQHGGFLLSAIRVFDDVNVESVNSRRSVAKRRKVQDPLQRIKEHDDGAGVDSSSTSEAEGPDPTTNGMELDDSVAYTYNMVVKTVTSFEEFQQIIQSDRISAFDFWATWCGPCKMISPVFDKLSNEYGDKIDFYKVDVDEQEQISQEVGIKAMPTFIFFKNGEKQSTVVGAVPAKLTDAIKLVLEA
ncbi:tRNA (adenine(58)-N(1))-methyltransferase non-catalytic subunit trm6 [Microbotryomycetes sp. JL201]|nr:tRNA (adenine(58)-N(1))-methyltransferase non-catalytic subunit trm6 [Microbotryomycetes sp. JL201]